MDSETDLSRKLPPLRVGVILGLYWQVQSRELGLRTSWDQRRNSQKSRILLSVVFITRIVVFSGEERDL